MYRGESMKLIHKMRHYLLEEEFEIHLFQNQIYVANYTKMGHFDNNKVMIYYQNGILEIKGEQLVVSKLMQEEILVTGKIKNIEFR